MSVPHLTTALSGPLLELERRILESQSEIEHWFRNQWQEYTPPFYGSVDLRNAGYKLAPVDMNLYPGGFNNLNPEFHPLAVQAAMSALESFCPDAKRLLLIPENHTRNQFYLQNVAALAKILRQAGLKVRIGTLNPEITEPTVFELANGSGIVLEPLVRKGDRIGLADFDPCVVLLNNDLSAGVPAILQGIAQTLLPPLHAGWYTRRKTAHFAEYDRVVDEFARLIGIDPWVINPYFARVGGLDFQAREGEDRLAAAVDEMLAKIRAKYAEHGIDQTPFVIVKADAGTYGMGIMSVKSGEELLGLNRKARNKMSVIKEGLQVHDVIVQEGVPTFEQIDDAIAEPVVYMLDRFVIGGFYRVHTERGIDENLNAPGAHFVPLAFAQALSTPDCDGSPDCTANRFYAYGVVARLALLAAAHELETTAPEVAVAIAV
ncbi:glutamate--cysteine ligase [Jeongeupia naejangsanensis]|uniref:Glutamate--cysteine ligase n=1 Tax=Jeongeupia naejangsanensis TaxID=613195 RepID=A0ABS2BPB5_9NEIS|nr:glutamate--cysteine ligase [Jeongeupia naejangsanensis]MBM3117438.1 glutamate--cysteine ligase [Jeongeupia naejangsanensis]